MSLFRGIVEELKSLETNLYENDFLLTWDKTLDEIKATVLVAEGLKYLHENNISAKCFDSGLAISQFRDNSTRTRFSFASAANLLGLALSDFDESKSQIAHGETVRETATMISFLTKVIGIRDDIYLGAGHRYMKEVSTALEEGYRDKILNSRPSIVNLQCDIDHPTQSLADLCWLKNYYGDLSSLKGKKITMSWAYSPSYGKPLSVPQGIIGLMSRFGMDITLTHPEGYELMPEVMDLAKKSAEDSGGSFCYTSSMDEAFQNADIVYPKSWAPYHVMGERTRLLQTDDEEGLLELEKSCLGQNAKFKNWECNSDRMKLTNGGNALYMHCLPADITDVSCSSGEVSKDVFERYRVATYKEASFKPYVIASMIVNSHFKNSFELLDKLKIRDTPITM